MRVVDIQRSFTKYAPGSVLISYGDTRVLCTVSVQHKVPFFLKDSGKGWLTAEYSLLPSSTHTRVDRELKKGKPTGRSQEIQRLIGRSLRNILDFTLFPDLTFQVDADVLQADGGTRTAAITGSVVALQDAVESLLSTGVLTRSPIKELCAAVSVGVINGEVYCDLDYQEDSNADVDMNIVMTESGKFIEVQGTAEKTSFSRDQLNQMLDIAEDPIIKMINSIKSYSTVIS